MYMYVCAMLATVNGVTIPATSKQRAVHTVPSVVAVKEQEVEEQR